MPEPSWAKASSALPPHPLGLCRSWILQPLMLPKATSILQEPWHQVDKVSWSSVPCVGVCSLCCAPLVLQGHRRLRPHWFDVAVQH